MRMLPLGNVLKPFPRMVRELGIEQDKQIELSITGEETLADKRILEEIKDPLVHLLRNAIDHGIETPDCRMAAGKPATGRLTIAASQAADQIVIEVSDDGTGLVPENIRAMARQRGLFTDHALAEMSLEQIQALILLPGFSTKRFVTDVSGRGVGMDVVKTNIDRLKGRLGIESVPGLGTRFTMRIPVALATMRVLLVDVGGFPYGLPTDNVGLTRTVAAAAVVTREGRNVVLYRGAPVPVARLVDLLGLPSPSVPSLPPDAGTPCVLLTVGKESFGNRRTALALEVKKSVTGISRRFHGGCDTQQRRDLYRTRAP
jgi:two-component system chemotaxis sensor kinase CheA